MYDFCLMIFLWRVILPKELVKLGLTVSSQSGPQGHIINGLINNKLAD